MPRSALASAWVLWALVSACGPRVVCSDADGCPGADAGDVGTGPEPPDIPWLEAGVPPIAPPNIARLVEGVPRIAWPCPEGWREVTEGGVTTCDPYPEGGALECPVGEAHFPGEAGCAPIGRACGDGPFPGVEDLDAATLLYVRADAEPGGDGSEAAPFATLTDALKMRARGTR
ncbi:MAG: hypothetical protein ACFCGT_07070 [Sandaracinaceae bacterium]